MCAHSCVGEYIYNSIYNSLQGLLPRMLVHMYMRGSNQFQSTRALLIILTSLPARENLTNEGSIFVRTTMHFGVP